MKAVNILFIALRLFLGGFMLYGGVQKFQKPMPSPVEVMEKGKNFTAPENEATLQKILYISGAKQTGYFWQVLGICELLFGSLLIMQYTSFVGAVFLLGPVTAVFAGIFLDEAAQYVEETWYGDEGPGRAVPLGQSLWLTARFTILVLFANLIALLLVLVPGINVAIFFLVNGYLLGREYFMFAAMRFRPEEEAAQLRANYSMPVFAAGMIIAGFMAIPFVNLATPVFAAAMMVHLHKALSGKSHDPARRA